MPRRALKNAKLFLSSFFSAKIRSNFDQSRFNADWFAMKRFVKLLQRDRIRRIIFNIQTEKLKEIFLVEKKIFRIENSTNIRRSFRSFGLTVFFGWQQGVSSVFVLFDSFKIFAIFLNRNEEKKKIFVGRKNRFNEPKSEEDRRVRERLTFCSERISIRSKLPTTFPRTNSNSEDDSSRSTVKFFFLFRSTKFHSFRPDRWRKVHWNRTSSPQFDLKPRKFVSTNVEHPTNVEQRFFCSTYHPATDEHR